ncbi:hypothetical protein Q7A53_05470 [Halobacillus rhizosphaerae]|uniref:hypothetical protein n=1 Tax=Halobacillus rhizosphaerae TaxID=3064889 RepID=UPI00398BB632
MANIAIFEGARGTGKSTLTHRFRQMIPHTTLINPTGFHDDGELGLRKVREYYYSWLDFLKFMEDHDSNIILDRFYFSEQIFSKKYKNYDFTDIYNQLNEHLFATNNEVKIFHLKADPEVLKERLVRDKVPFGKAEESVKESIWQQNAYTELFEELLNDYPDVEFHKIKTNKSIEVIDKIVRPWVFN